MPEIPPEVEKIKEDFVWAKLRLDEYQKLFFHGKEDRIELLRETAFLFFENLFWLFRDQLIIDTSRLTEPYKKGKNKNLTINILPILAKELSWEFENELSEKVELITGLAEPIRRIRNKITAHRDLPTSENESLLLKEVDIKIELFREIYELIGDCLNIIYSGLVNTENRFDLIGRGNAAKSGACRTPNSEQAAQ